MIKFKCKCGKELRVNTNANLLGISIECPVCGCIQEGKIIPAKIQPMNLKIKKEIFK